MGARMAIFLTTTPPHPHPTTLAVVLSLPDFVLLPYLSEIAIHAILLFLVLFRGRHTTQSIQSPRQRLVVSTQYIGKTKKLENAQPFSSVPHLNCYNTLLEKNPVVSNGITESLLMQILF